MANTWECIVFLIHSPTYRSLISLDSQSFVSFPSCSVFILCVIYSVSSLPLSAAARDVAAAHGRSCEGKRERGLKTCKANSPPPAVLALSLSFSLCGVTECRVSVLFNPSLAVLNVKLQSRGIFLHCPFKETVNHLFYCRISARELNSALFISYQSMMRSPPTHPAGIFID